MNEWFNKRLNRWVVDLDDGRRTYRYRWVMEQHLGRELRTDEHVHHINGDSTDDRLENLQILSPSEHGRLHGRDQKERMRRKWKHEWSRDYAGCVECGRSDRKRMGRGLCELCYYAIVIRARDGRSPRGPAKVLNLVCGFCGAEFTRTSRSGPGTYCSRSCASIDNAQLRWAKRRANAEARKAA